MCVGGDGISCYTDTVLSVHRMQQPLLLLIRKECTLTHTAHIHQA
jgi:hypothetical protein